MFTSSLLNPDRTPSKQKAFLVGGSLTNCTTTEFLAETAEAPLRIQPRRGDRTLPSAGVPSTPAFGVMGWSASALGKVEEMIQVPEGRPSPHADSLAAATSARFHQPARRLSRPAARSHELPDICRHIRPLQFQRPRAALLLAPSAQSGRHSGQPAVAARPQSSESRNRAPPAPGTG